MARKSKSKAENINAKISLAIKSGKFTFGYKQALKNLRSGKAKLVIVANNTPSIRKSEIEYYAMLSKTTLYHFKGNNVELGTVCSSLYGVGVVTILDFGESGLDQALLN